jgi:hypothetical protein
MQWSAFSGQRSAKEQNAMKKKRKTARRPAVRSQRPEVNWSESSSSSCGDGDISIRVWIGEGKARREIPYGQPIFVNGGPA